MNNALEVPQENLYWSPNQLLSYNRYLNMVIGGRGIGKTYGIKKFLIKRFLEHGEQFVYLRRHKSNLKDGTVAKFFDKISNEEEFKNVEFKVKGFTFYINGKECGFAIPLSGWQSRKGSEYPNVYNIFMDEFLKEEDSTHYLPNEPQALLSMAESIFREKIIFDTEKVRIICASNSTTVANPYFIYFKLLPDITKRFNTFKHNKEIVIEIPTMLEFKEKKLSGRFGELIKGTNYADISIENKFVYDKNDFLMKRTKESKFKFAIDFDGFTFGVWVDVTRTLMFLSTKYDSGSKKIYALSKDDFNERNILASNYKEHYHLLRMVTAFKNGQLRFENQTVRSIAYDMFQKMNVK